MYLISRIRKCGTHLLTIFVRDYEVSYIIYHEDLTNTIRILFLTSLVFLLAAYVLENQALRFLAAGIFFLDGIV